MPCAPWHPARDLAAPLGAPCGTGEPLLKVTTRSHRVVRREKLALARLCPLLGGGGLGLGFK